MEINVIQQKETTAGECVQALQGNLERPYQLRKLQARDISTMAKIIGKIGIDELVSCYGDDDFTELMVKLKNRKRIVDNEAGSALQSEMCAVPAGNLGTMPEDKDNSGFIIGMAVATRIANQILMNLDKCEKEVYGFLGGLSGMPGEEIAMLDLDVFAQMIVDVVRENNVVNFIKAAAKFLK